MSALIPALIELAINGFRRGGGGGGGYGGGYGRSPKPQYTPEQKAMWGMDREAEKDLLGRRGDDNDDLFASQLSELSRAVERFNKGTQDNIRRLNSDGE